MVSMFLYPLPCLEKVLHLGKPQERTFRFTLYPASLGMLDLVQDVILLFPRI